MRNSSVLLSFPLFLSLWISLGFGFKPFSAEANPTEGISQQKVHFEQNLGIRLPSSPLFLDQNGQSHPFGFYLNQNSQRRQNPVILVFTYFKCPNLCTLILDGLVRALRQIPDQIEKDYSVITVSINPAERPSLALTKQRTYLAKLGLPENPGWTFLTAPPGEEKSILALTDRAGFSFYKDPHTGEFAHPSGILVLTPTGMISQVFFGIQYDSKLLHQALVQARSEKRGSWVEEILLYCFHYDPKLSQNGPTIIRAIRLAGIGGTLFLIAFLFFLFYSERRSRSQGTRTLL